MWNLILIVVLTNQQGITSQTVTGFTSQDNCEEQGHALIMSLHSEFGKSAGFAYHCTKNY